MARLIRCDRCGHQGTLGGPDDTFGELYFERAGEVPIDLCQGCEADVRAHVADARHGGLRGTVDNIVRLLLDAGMDVNMDRPEHAVANLVVQRDAAVRQLEASEGMMRRRADPPTAADRII